MSGYKKKCFLSSDQSTSELYKIIVQLCFDDVCCAFLEEGLDKDLTRMGNVGNLFCDSVKDVL